MALASAMEQLTEVLGAAPDLQRVWNRIAQRPFQAYSGGEAKGDQKADGFGAELQDPMPLDAAVAVYEVSSSRIRPTHTHTLATTHPFRSLLVFLQAWYRAKRMRHAYEALDQVLAEEDGCLGAVQREEGRGGGEAAVEAATRMGAIR